MTLHFIMVFRSKKGFQYITDTHTLTGEDMVRRMESIIKLQSESWSDEWELVSLSHTFLPFKATGQIG